MNRRDFFKKIGITCAVAVAAPATLVKAKKKCSIYVVDCDTWKKDRKCKGIKKIIINIGSDKYHYTLNKHGNWILNEKTNKRR